MFGHQTQSEWFFDSSVHLEAVSRLLYLVESHEPLGLVQGPDGSGRSRVLGRLREELSRTGIMTVPLPLSGMDEESALWQLAEGLCARLRPSMRRHELLSLVRDELSGRGRCGVQTVILLDDFHRAAGDMNMLLRVLRAMSDQSDGMLTVIVTSGKSLPVEFSETLVPIHLSELDSAESSDFARHLMTHQSVRPASVDESAVRAISLTSVGNAAKISRICALLQVIHETSPETHITEETVYSLLSEFATGNGSPVMRAS